jgi:hypothetical protein
MSTMENISEEEENQANEGAKRKILRIRFKVPRAERKEKDYEDEHNNEKDKEDNSQHSRNEEDDDKDDSNERSKNKERKNDGVHQDSNLDWIHDRSTNSKNLTTKPTQERNILRSALAVGIYEERTRNPHAFKVLLGKSKYITPAIEETLNKWKPGAGFRVSYRHNILQRNFENKIHHLIMCLFE